MSSRSVSESQIVEALLDAYRRGYFPMADVAPRWATDLRTHIYWPSPDPRGVLPLTEAEGFHVPRSLRRRINSGGFMLRSDTSFEAVIRGCALPRQTAPEENVEGDGAWIDETLIRWYLMLHRAGHAHSIEAWRQDPATGRERLVGGVYGVAIGAAFFGESMFHLARPRRADGSRDPLDGTDASKVCLVALVDHLASLGYQLFDTQMVTEHVRRFGGREIPRAGYLKLLAKAVAGADLWRPLPARR